MSLTSQPDGATPPQAGTKERFAFWIVKFVATIFWVYAICKLFIFDIDVYLINFLNPKYLWISNYKFFIIISIITVILLCSKSLYIVFWVLYIVFYPIILLVWTIPSLLFKNGGWAMLLAFLNSLISLFIYFKTKFVAGTFFLISIFFIVTFSDSTVIIASASGVLAILFFSYARAWIVVFQPSIIFQIYQKTATKCSEFVVNSVKKSDDEVTLPTHTLSEQQIQIRRTNIQSLVVANRFMLFYSLKLKEYQESKIGAAAHTFSILLLLLVTIIAFAAINYALFKVDASQFGMTTEATPFIFFYYSFKTFLLGSIAEVSPNKLYAQILSMLEQGFEIAFFSICASMLISVRSEKYKEELEKTIRAIERTGKILEGLIHDTYSMTLPEALDEIRKMQNNLLSVILWLSKDLE